MATETYDALALLSGGLDSILAMRTVMDQGLSVLGLHFVTPFFGNPELLPLWRERYGVEGVAVDVGPAFVDMLLDGPAQGFGKRLNPCIDCKILMLGHAARLLPEYGASFLISGEVMGQRPMSQREDALHLISKRAGVRDLLLRPLSAQKLPPTPMETDGRVDRERLRDWYGRGRRPQLTAAETYGFTEVPTPAGGCCLAEVQGAARFVRLLAEKRRPTPDDFALARVGRQYWAGSHWLTFGRTDDDNERIGALARPGDHVFKTRGFPGPLAVCRPVAGEWSEDALADAAAFVASYSGKARRHAEATGEPIQVRIHHDGAARTIAVNPARETRLPWTEPDPALVKEWKKDQVQ